MRVFRVVAAFLGSVVITFVLASGFYTQQVLAKRAEIGAVYTTEQQIGVYLDDFIGLAPSWDKSTGFDPGYGGVLAVGLLIGFLVAAGVKRILVPLAPIAYPVAGAAAVFVVLWAVETFVAKGSGAFEGASGPVGIALQCLAGFVGGLVFALARGRGN